MLWKLWMLTVWLRQNQTTPKLHWLMLQTVHVCWINNPTTAIEKGGCQTLLGHSRHSFLFDLLLFLPCSLTSSPGKLLTEAVTSPQLYSTQPATGSVPPWPLASLKPSLGSELFLKHCVRITAERRNLSKWVVRWEIRLMWQKNV